MTSGRFARSSSLEPVPARPRPWVDAVARSGGAALDDTVRVAAEARFGLDFGDVRVHADEQAGRSASEIDAAAYTVGRHVVFAPGRYAPGTDAGRRLIDHELTHVVQHARSPGPGAGTISSPGDPSEREARAVAGGAPALAVAATPGAGVHRDDLPAVELRPPPLLARSMGSLTVDGFALNKADLPAGAAGRLSGLAASLASLLRSYPSGSVTIVGYTDATGDEAGNAVLGQQRADAALAALKDGGIAPAIVSTSSAGAGSPVVPAAGAEPRNRRVQISFDPEPGMRFRGVLGGTLRAPDPLPPVTPPPSSTTGPTSGPTVADPFPHRPPVGPGVGPPLGPRARTSEDEDRDRRIFTPIPPAPGPQRPTGTPTSASDRLNSIVDRALAPVTKHLPGWARTVVQAGAHAAANAATNAPLNAALDKAGVTGTDRDAITNAFEAAKKAPIR